MITRKVYSSRQDTPAGHYSTSSELKVRLDFRNSTSPNNVKDVRKRARVLSSTELASLKIMSDHPFLGPIDLGEYLTSKEELEKALPPYGKGQNPNTFNGLQGWLEVSYPYFTKGLVVDLKMIGNGYMDKLDDLVDLHGLDDWIQTGILPEQRKHDAD